MPKHSSAVPGHTPGTTFSRRVFDAPAPAVMLKRLVASRSSFTGTFQRLRDAAVGAALTGGDPRTALRDVDQHELRAALADKTLIVTGASSGIGRAVAIRAAAAGARVVVVARSAEALRSLEETIRGNGGTVRAYAAALSSGASSGVTRERALGTRLAELWQLGHVVAPGALEAVLAWAQNKA